MITRDAVRLALEAAGNLRGLTLADIERGAQGSKRARALAGAGAIAAGLTDRETAIPLFGVGWADAMQPFELAKAAIYPEHVQAVAETLKGGPLPVFRDRAVMFEKVKLPPKNTPWSDEVVARLKALFNEGLMHKEIAVVLQMEFSGEFGACKVGRKLQRLGLTLTLSQAAARSSRNGKAAARKGKAAKRRVFNPPLREAANLAAPPITTDERDLIAAFLARKSVTVCPGMPAWGAVVPSYIGKGKAA